MTKREVGKRGLELLMRVRAKRPLIHSITNHVVMNSTANVVLALGGSPLMAHAREEMDEITSLADALVLNIGTLEPSWVDSMVLAGESANRKGIPIVLDPVGVGASRLRRESVERLLRLSPTVIRGNASEIMTVAGMASRSQGVDSLEKTDEAREAARSLADSSGSIVAATGEVDFITDGTRSFEVHNGHPLFASVTGTGCGATVAVAVFAAVCQEDPLIATAAALGCYGLAGEMAAEKANGPGSFQVALYDALFNLNPQGALERLKIQAT